MPFCTNCGMGVEEKERFCANCGKPQEIVEQVQQIEKKALPDKRRTFHLPLLIIPLFIIVVVIAVYILFFNDKHTDSSVEPVQIKAEELVEAELNDRELRGNSVGNIVNYGLAAQQGDWIYYTSNDGGIFKILTDGTKRTQINNDSSSSINIVGDWIYYANYNNYGKIYKIRTDGTERTKINDDSASYINVIEGWIYYRNNDDGYKLYKIRTDGTERNQLNDESSSFINVVGDWIYYTSGEIYKIRTDGTERAQINNEESIYINVIGEWIYYVINNYFLRGEIYKIRIDGTERTMVIDDNQASRINVVDDWIYYTIKGKLYKTRTDGTEKIQLSEDISDNINVVGDWIYYYNSHDHQNYKIRVDGSDPQKVDDKSDLKIAAEVEVIVNVDYLRLRSGPSTGHEILDRFMEGDKLILIGIENEWLKVITAEGKDGWVHGGYVVSREDLVKIELNTQPHKPYSHHLDHPETGLEGLGLIALMPIEEIISIMGEPKGADEYDGGMKGPSIRLEYDGILFGLSKYDNRYCLDSYEITSSKIVGPRGIRVGDTVESVLRKYLLTNTELNIWESPEGLYYSNISKTSIELYNDEESGPYTKSGYISTNNLTGEINYIVYSHYLPYTCGISSVSFNIQNGLVEKIRWHDF